MEDDYTYNVLCEIRDLLREIKEKLEKQGGVK